MYNNSFLPYQSYSPNYQSNILPPQQVLKANGKASIDALQMSPNSEVLIMDTTAPIIWQCMSDGLGKVTATAWDIVAHKEAPTINLETRVSAIEAALKELKEREDAKSHVGSGQPSEITVKSEAD